MIQIVTRNALVFFDRIEKRNGTPGLGNHGNVKWAPPRDRILPENSVEPSISVRNYQLKTLGIIVQIQNTPPIRFVHTAIG